MKQQFKVWGSRAFAVVLLALAVQYKGVPLYKQYFTKKETAVYIPATKVKQGSFVVSFHEMGALQAEKSVPVISEINGKMIYLVSEGAMVKAGDKLCEIDTSDLQREVLNQQLEYNNRQADIDRVNAELDILKKQNETEYAEQQAQFDFDTNELALAREKLTRIQGLYKDKLVTRSEVDQAEMEVRSKEFTIKKGDATLKLKAKQIQNQEEQKAADVRHEKFRAQLAKMQLDEAERRVKKAVIMAPASGMVVLDDDWGPEGRRKLQSGDTVRPQQTILSLPNLDSMLVKVQLGEADAPKVEIGLPVLIRLEAVPKRVFHGTVKRIASLATEPLPWERTSSNGKSFEVIVAVKEVEPKTLKPGMTADVEVIRKTVKSAIYVPLEAVTEDNGKTWVYVKNGKNWKKTEVKVGTSNDNFVCITKGLKVGQSVALHDPTKAAEEQNSEASTGSEDSAQKKGKEVAPLPSTNNKKTK